MIPCLVNGQTHPCDENVVVNPTVSIPFGIGFCSTDTNLTRVKVYQGTTIIFDVAVTKVGSPNTGGLIYYETAKTLTTTAGVKTYSVASVNNVGEGPAVPFPFIVQESLPSSVLKPRIVK